MLFFYVQPDMLSMYVAGEKIKKLFNQILSQKKKKMARYLVRFFNFMFTMYLVKVATFKP
jgi:hypothetical protein